MRPFQYEKENKHMIDTYMQRLAHLGILKQDISPYSSPTMIIARNN